MTQAWLTRGDVRLSVDDAGGTGLPVILQHGLCGDARQTAEAMPADPRFRRLTLECRGHGASPRGGDYTIAAFAGDVAALAKTLPGPVPIGGISMGAAIALRLAVICPGLVRALILIRPAWVTGAAPPNMAPNAEVGRLLATLPQDAARAAFLAGPIGTRLAEEAPDNLASLTGMFDRAPVADTAHLLRAISADGPGVTEAQLAALDLPVLVCATGRDAVHPLDLAHHVAALIPGARFVELPPKATDKPAHLAALHVALSEFLEELQPCPHPPPAG